MLLGSTDTLRFVAKPAGLPVFPPHADPAGDCVLARLLVAFPDQAGDWPAGFEGGIAHRLDTLTSGFLVVARTPEVLAQVRAEWGELRKRYWFRSAGQLSAPAVVLTAPIAHHAKKKARMVVQGGRERGHRGKWLPAWTQLRALGGDWFEAEIRTGVMHQIRAHAAFAGVPLSGDTLYGGGDGTPTLVHVEIEGPRWTFRLPEPPARESDTA